MPWKFIKATKDMKRIKLLNAFQIYFKDKDS